MYTTKKIAVRRYAFTLVEMLVVIAIMLALAALAATFAPRVNDDQKMSRAVDNLEQWLLTAKMRAKRDGLATGIRFVQTQGDINIDPGLKLVPPVPTIFSQFQYIQQPEPLSGSPGGGTIAMAQNGIVTFTPGTVDFTLGLSSPPQPHQWLVQPGDSLEINGGGVFMIGQVGMGSPTNTLILGMPNATNPPTSFYTLAPTQSVYDLALKIDMLHPTTNYRILRQPRLLIGEEPLTLPNNYAACFSAIPGSGSNLPGCNVAKGFSGYPEILFSPSGAVVGTNSSNTTLVISVWDVPSQAQQPDPNRVGLVGIQCRSGFIGAYNVSLSGNPFLFVQTARASGL